MFMFDELPVKYFICKNKMGSGVIHKVQKKVNSKLPKSKNKVTEK